MEIKKEPDPKFVAILDELQRKMKDDRDLRPYLSELKVQGIDGKVEEARQILAEHVYRHKHSFIKKKVQAYLRILENAQKRLGRLDKNSRAHYTDHLLRETKDKISKKLDAVRKICDFYEDYRERVFTYLGLMEIFIKDKNCGRAEAIAITAELSKYIPGGKVKERAISIDIERTLKRYESHFKREGVKTKDRLKELQKLLGIATWTQFTLPLSIIVMHCPDDDLCMEMHEELESFDFSRKQDYFLHAYLLSLTS